MLSARVSTHIAKLELAVHCDLVFVIVAAEKEVTETRGGRADFFRDFFLGSNDDKGSTMHFSEDLTSV